MQFPEFERPLETMAMTFENPLAADPAQVFKCRGIIAQHLPIAGAGQFAFAWRGTAHYLSLQNLRQDAGETFADHRKPSRLRDHRDLLTFVPPLHRLWGWSRPIEGRHSLTAVYVQQRELDADAARRFDTGGLEPRLDFGSVPLQSIMTKLRMALSDPNGFDSLYLETLCLIVALDLSRLKSADEESAVRPAGGLTRSHEKRVTDFIEEHLATDMALAELADVVGLSRFHFVRAFKRSLGLTPYQYLLQRRVGRAKTLLRETDLPIAAIVRDVGFKSPTSFNRVFRRLCGTTPVGFRGKSG